MGTEEPRLPPGYGLDTSDPDVWTLRRPEGWVVAHFSARGATKEALEQVPTLHVLLQERANQEQ
jgi:hypothetical protein